MKGLLVVLLSMVCVVYVFGQTCPSGSNDFIIFNGPTQEFRIEANTGDVFLCSNSNLCDFISNSPWTTEAGTNGEAVFKTVPGTFYSDGRANPSVAYDGIPASTVNSAGRKFFFYGGKGALRSGELLGNTKGVQAWSDANIGIESVAFGVSTIASGQASTALGYESEAVGTVSTAFGTKYDVVTASGVPTSSLPKINTQFFESARGPLAVGVGSTAFGASTQATGTVSTAFGVGGEATQAASLVFGVQNTASGEASTAFGYFSVSTGYLATAFGQQTTATQESATSFGRESTASGVTSTAFGYKTTAAGPESTAFGFESETTSAAQQATAFGYKTKATGIESTAFGHESQATATSATSFGRLTKASGQASVAIGIDYITANSPQRIVTAPLQVGSSGSPRYQIPMVGPEATASGSLAFGGSTVASGIFSTAFGLGTIAQQPSATAFGTQSEAGATNSGVAATAFGFHTLASGDYSTSFGESTEASEARTTAFGYESRALFPDATAFGFGTIAQSYASTTLGSLTFATTFAELVAGTCNQNFEVSNNDPLNSRQNFNPVTPAFTVGNGIPTASNPQDQNCNTFSNALTVLKSGDLFVNGNIYFSSGADPYATMAQLSSAGCTCLSSNTATCESGCTPYAPMGGKRSAVDLSDFESLRGEVDELKRQITELKKLIKA